MPSCRLQENISDICGIESDCSQQDVLVCFLTGFFAAEMTHLILAEGTMCLLIAKEHLFSAVITSPIFADSAMFFFIVKEKPFLAARTFPEFTDSNVRILFVEGTFFPQRQQN